MVVQGRSRVDQDRAPWWNVLLAGPVSYLAGADPELVGVALDPAPAGAPAVVRFRPTGAGSSVDQVSALLHELDSAALTLFPRWLPGAERLDGPHGLGISAARALAGEAAARSANFGPFLADLAARAMQRASAPRSRFPAEVRAAGLARVIADAYGRDSLAVLVDVPLGLSSDEERGLASAAEWFATHSRAVVWLAGAPLQVVDRVRSVTVQLPARIRTLEAEARRDVRRLETTDHAVLSYPPVSGYPRTDSAPEKALEAALQPQEWAHGRHWNRTYEWHSLGETYRLDLFWPEEGVVVEVDGDDHRTKVKFAADRRRDVHLQLQGLDVLRFTNEQVMQDVHLVLSAIKGILAGRRADPKPLKELLHHVG